MKREEVKVGMSVLLPFNEEGVVDSIKSWLWIGVSLIRITKGSVFNQVGDIVEFTCSQLSPITEKRYKEEKERPFLEVREELSMKELTLRQEIELDRLKGDVLIYKTKIAVESTMGRTFVQSVAVNKEIVRVLQNKITKVEGGEN